jgi:hypothetical protein
VPTYVSQSNKILERRHTQLLKLFGGNCCAKLSHAAVQSISLREYAKEIILEGK